ncbi:hypothetical protein PENTCL1PPCAC_22267, partial [Pristionchus entomophagus]
LSPLRFIFSESLLESDRDSLGRIAISETICDPSGGPIGSDESAVRRYGFSGAFSHISRLAYNHSGETTGTPPRIAASTF